MISIHSWVFPLQILVLNNITSSISWSHSRRLLAIKGLEKIIISKQRSHAIQLHFHGTQNRLSCCDDFFSQFCWIFKPVRAHFFSEIRHILTFDRKWLELLPVYRQPFFSFSFFAACIVSRITSCGCFFSFQSKIKKNDTMLNIKLDHA